MYIDAASQIHATANLGLFCFFSRSVVRSFVHSFCHDKFTETLAFAAYISFYIGTNVQFIPMPTDEFMQRMENAKYKPEIDGLVWFALNPKGNLIWCV